MNLLELLLLWDYKLEQRCHLCPAAALQCRQHVSVSLQLCGFPVVVFPLFNLTAVLFGLRHSGGSPGRLSPCLPSGGGRRRLARLAGTHPDRVGLGERFEAEAGLARAVFSWGVYTQLFARGQSEVGV